jgi:hypothetical protein
MAAQYKDTTFTPRRNKLFQPFLHFSIQHGLPWSGFWPVFRWTSEPFCTVIQANHPYSAL